MIQSPKLTRRARRLAALALCAAPIAPSFAADNGCYHSANGYYEIDPPGDLIVNEAIAPGEVIRDYAAHGKGSVLATCMEGTAILEGGYTVPVSGDLVPLTIGGAASGFGVRLRIEELADSRRFPFPHRYTRVFRKGDPIRTNDADMGVEIVRMPGEIRFGKVEDRIIAQQWSYQPDGPKTAAFRHVSTKNIVFARATCSLVPDDLNQTVNLTPISLSAFGNPERATPWESFHIGVADCKDPKGMIARFVFGQGSDGYGPQKDLFSLSGPANVGLELGNRDKQNIKPGVAIDLPALATGERFDFFARMREANGTVQAGRFTRPVKVDVEFH
jgi:type 1 fimbria pilin